MTDDEPDIVLISTPHERKNGQTTAAPAPDRDSFYKLSEISTDKARELGMQRWTESEDPEGDLWLFPVEWYNAIPRGFEVETIGGEKKRFSQWTCSRDRRRGALAFGIRL